MEINNVLYSLTIILCFISNDESVEDMFQNSDWQTKARKFIILLQNGILHKIEKI